MEADRSTYLLWKRFSMPTQNGSRDAVSVSFEDGKKLLSAYTLMVDLMVLQLWALIVLASISTFMRKAHSPNIGAASAAIWNSQGSAFSVLKLMAKYFFYMKKKRDRWYVLLWMSAAAALIAVAYAVSIWLPRFLILGNGAPVNPKSIFVPKHEITRSMALYQEHSLRVPSSLRAAGSVNATTLQSVTMSNPVVTTGVNGTIKQVGYAYSITGAEFGLQHAAGLTLNVEGSCITEYKWLVDSQRDIQNLSVDSYYLYGLESKQQTLSLYDGRAPIAYFRLGPESKSNTSFAIAISSTGRLSYSPGSDPLYATNSSERSKPDPPYVVKEERPILSCWQNDIWSYKGHTSGTSGLSGLPGLNMPKEVQTHFFEHFLGLPMIVTLGVDLGSRALQSASTAVEQVFDAGSSSMESDLHQLVAAAYIASKNVFPDTTTIKSNHNNITNVAIDPITGALYPGAADFIVTSRDIATLSVKVLVVIPVLLAFLFLIVTILTNSPASWNKAQALQATILYSCLDEGGTGGKWNRASEIAYYHADIEHQAVLKPEFKKGAGLYWTRHRNKEIVPSPPASKVEPQDALLMK